MTDGGLAATVLADLPPQVLDTDTLPDGAAAEMHRLVSAAARSVAEGTEEPSSLARDAMSYSITVEEGGHASVLVQSDTTMSAEFAALLRRLRQHTARQ
ncbi:MULTISPECIES: protealysin inhibitor emfourin [unclassified Streptomyces]|uniref:protealysin inhibitor emfourin n=1 Tax=unclassified Streptomyces TaxID=2593676 RepID=UPI001F5BD313|nr:MULTISPECIES: protealysin inhibitor emfourin [unclassified Streptomyces]